MKPHLLKRATAWSRGDKPTLFGQEGRKDETAAPKPVALGVKKESKC